MATDFPAQEFELVLERALEVARHRIGAAIEQVGAEILDEIKFDSSSPNPPPFLDSSKPGEYPRARTFEFVEGLNMAYDDAAMALSLWSKTHDRHGWYLQNKMRDGTKRPYATLALTGRDWARRIVNVAQAMNE
jgi:hypothetical protein